MLKTAATIFSALDAFWFRVEPPYSLGLFRIVFGVFLLVLLLISYPNWERFYGPSGSLPFSALAEPFTGYSWSIFALTDKPWFPWVIFWIGILAAAAFTVGLQTRVATISLFLIFASMLHRNPFLINGQDQIATMLLFFSCFAPVGDSFSFDRRINYRRHPVVSAEPIPFEPKPIWSMRLMQVSIALIYLFSGPAKYFQDIAWRNGSAIYYVTLSDAWFRFPNVVLFHNEIVSAFLTFGTLAIEIGFPFLIWFPRTGPFMLVSIALFHFSMLVLMSASVFFFNLMMLVAFTLFIPPSTIERLLSLPTSGKNVQTFFSSAATGH